MLKALLIFTWGFFLAACSSTIINSNDTSGSSAIYQLGKLEADVVALPIPIAQATKRAFNALSITPDEFHQTDLDAKITGYTANGDEIKVIVKRKSETVSNISIRVGFFGDEAMSQLIYEEIRRQLKNQTQVITAPVLTTPPSATSSSVAPASAATPAPATSVVAPTTLQTNG